MLRLFSEKVEPVCPFESKLQIGSQLVEVYLHNHDALQQWRAVVDGHRVEPRHLNVDNSLSKGFFGARFPFAFVFFAAELDRLYRKQMQYSVGSNPSDHLCAPNFEPGPLCVPQLDDGRVHVDRERGAVSRQRLLELAQKQAARIRAA